MYVAQLLHCSQVQIFAGQMDLREAAAARNVSCSRCMMRIVASPAHKPESQQRFEEQLRATLNMIPAYAWYAAPGGALRFVNERSADYGGLPKDHPLRFGEGAGEEWDLHIAFLHPDDREETRRVWAECLRTGRANEVTFRVRGADGGYRWFLSRAEPVRDANGTVLYWVGVNLDIEERKQAEFELRRSEAHLADAQRLSRTGSVGMERSSKRLFWSEEAARIYGYPPGTQPTPELILQRSHPDDLNLLKEVLHQAAQGANDFDWEHRLVLPDGSIKYLHDLAHCIRDDSGNEEIVGAIMDITERKLAEAEQRRSEIELRQILDLTPQLIAVFGPHYRERLFINRIGLEYHGLTLDEWRDAAPGALGHPDDSKRVKEMWDRALLSGSAFVSEGRLRKSDGSYRWFLIRYNPVRDEEGKVLRWYAASTDIDDRKRLEEKLQQENVALREEIDKASMFEEIVGTSPALQAVLSRISKVAPTNSTVLITGETGTGKELVARAIHRRSQRASHAFVSVNCAAIPRDLIASELFGHEKGAFTGAMQRRIGRFELAEGGTIFLDEVGELSAETQVALLRVLQEREFERVGGTQPIHTDVRVIAATNRDLKAGVASGIFRQDLFYRLNVFPVEVPPLRERTRDIPLLVNYFVDRYARKAGKNIKSIDKKTVQLLQAYPWPGNIRELQNVIERSVIVCETQTFLVDESWLSQQPRDEKAGGKLFLSQKLAATEKEIIERALRESLGRVSGPSGAANKLGIARSTLEMKIRSLKINKNRFRENPGS